MIIITAILGDIEGHPVCGYPLGHENGRFSFDLGPSEWHFPAGLLDPYFEGPVSNLQGSPQKSG
jgi:hypothetical protein